MVCLVSAFDLSWYNEFQTQESARSSNHCDAEELNVKKSDKDALKVTYGEVWNKIRLVQVQMTEYHVICDRYLEELALNENLMKTCKRVGDDPVEEDELVSSMEDYINTLQLGHECLSAEHKALEDEIAAIENELAQSREKEISNEIKLSQLTAEINALSGSTASRWVSSCRSIRNFHRMRYRSTEKENRLVIAGRPRPWNYLFFREKQRCSASGTVTTCATTSVRSFLCDDLEDDPQSLFSTLVMDIQAY